MGILVFDDIHRNRASFFYFFLFNLNIDIDSYICMSSG